MAKHVPHQAVVDKQRIQRSSFHVISALCVCIPRLTNKPISQKRIAITVFSFPPDKGNVGTAAYLNVFGSIFRVLQDLQADGYDVGQLPEDESALMHLVGA